MKASPRQLRTGKPAADKARLLALDLLGQWNNAGLDREELLNACLPRDRALVKNLVTGTLRMRGLIDFYLEHFLKTGKDALPGRVLDILRLAVFQLRFCDRIPDYAVVNDAVELARPFYRGKYVPLVNAVLRGFLREGGKIALPRREDDPALFLAVKHSHPRWLVGRYLKRFGFEGTESLLKANNAQAPLTVRVRSPETVRAFREAGLETRKGAWAPEALAVGRRLQPSRLPGYGQGLFYVQDEAQMLVGRLAAPQPGATIADLCAAPGGKATHLAELAGPDALVVAADTGAGGLEKLRENLDRLRLSCVRLVAADARRPAISRADTVLCDVPCSGSGVLRRKPELRWRIRPQSLKKFSNLQREIISAACRCVAPGGVLVYSTCSLEPEENSQVVDWFLASTADFVLEHAQKYLGPAPVSERGFLETFPHLHGTDGVFAARLRRETGARAGK